MSTVYLHPTAMSERAIQRIQRRTGRIAVIESNGRRVRLVAPKPRLIQPAANNDWPPFGGDAA